MKVSQLCVESETIVKNRDFLLQNVFFWKYGININIKSSGGGGLSLLIYKYFIL